MKKLLLFSTISLFLVFSALAGKSKKTTLTITYVFANIVDGYDHNSIGKIFIDGDKVHETKEHLESKKQKITLDVKPGKRNVRVEIWNEYEGQWEIHTVDNNYSIDAVVDEDFRLKSGKNLLNITFDIDDDTRYELK